LAQRVGAFERLRGHPRQRLTRLAAAFCEDLVGDGSRPEEGTGANEVACRLVFLLQPSKGQREGDGYRRMIRNLSAARTERRAPGAVQLRCSSSVEGISSM
jgi:hypothetical protein